MKGVGFSTNIPYVADCGGCNLVTVLAIQCSRGGFDMLVIEAQLESQTRTDEQIERSLGFKAPTGQGLPIAEQDTKGHSN